MNRWKVPLAIVLCAAALGCGGRKGNLLEGTWELVTVKYTSPDTTIDFLTSGSRQIKIFTKSHWAFLSHRIAREKFTGEGTDSQWVNAAKTFFAGCGTYVLDGDTYTEHIEFFMNPNFVGMSVPFKVRMEGDLLIQTGTLPLKAAGVSDRDAELYEAYRRIE